MHELSIAIRLVESLEEELAGHGDVRVATVNLRIGALTGLVPEALEFSWEVASEGSRLAGSALAIETVQAAGFCPECQIERTISNLQSFRCPECGAPITQVTGGHELEILTLEVFDGESPDEELAPVSDPHIT
jgi:hydrogenase nickel incorporation protein HypA/HybF